MYNMMYIHNTCPCTLYVCYMFAYHTLWYAVYIVCVHTGVETYIAIRTNKVFITGSHFLELSLRNCSGV